MVSDEMRLIAATAYWEAYRDAWRPLAILPERFDVPFADMPNRHAREATLSAIGQALEAVAPAIRAAAMEKAAILVETHVYTVSNVEPVFSLQPSLRAKEDMHHRTIAAAIRAAKETT